MELLVLSRCFVNDSGMRAGWEDGGGRVKRKKEKYDGLHKSASRATESLSDLWKLLFSG